MNTETTTINVLTVSNVTMAENYVRQQLHFGVGGSAIIGQLRLSQHNGYDISDDNSLAVFHYQGEAIVITSGGYYNLITGQI